MKKFIKAGCRFPIQDIILEMNPELRQIKFKKWLYYGLWDKFVWLEDFEKMTRFQRFLFYFFGWRAD